MKPGFAAWKKRSRLFVAYTKGYINWHGILIEKVCAAAYKAGERQGRKDVEAIAKRAIELRAKLFKEWK